MAGVRYRFNQLAGDALDQARHFVSEEIGVLDCAHLNNFLKLLKMTYDDPDWVCMAARKIQALKQKTSFCRHTWHPSGISLGIYIRMTRQSKTNFTRNFQKSWMLDYFCLNRWITTSSLLLPTATICTTESKLGTRKGRLLEDRSSFWPSSLAARI